MTFKECLSASCCTENFLFAVACLGMERPALKAQDRVRRHKCNSNPSCLMHSNTTSCAATSASSFQAAALSESQQLLPTPASGQAVATAAPVATAAGREILDAACRPCRHWQPAKSTAPTVVFQPMRGEICRAILQWSPVCLQGKLPGSWQLCSSAALAATGRACQHVLQSDPGARLECPHRMSALTKSSQ